MEVQKLQNNNIKPSFCAGNVILNRISEKELFQYDIIKKIAQEDKLDLNITKSEESKYFPQSNCYIVIARQEMNTYPYMARGVDCLILNKKSETKEVSAKLYNSVIKSVERLAVKILECTGKRPEFLKYLKK